MMHRTAFRSLIGLATLLVSVGCASATAPDAPAPAAAQPADQGPAYSVAAIRAVGKHKGDYLPAHNFKLEIDGVISGGFDGAYDADYKNGDDPITHKRAGKAKYKNITLKRGFVNDPALLDWYKKVLAGTTDRKSGSVIFLDRESGEVVRMNLEGARPTHIKSRDVGYNVQIVEELTFAVEEATFKTRHDTAKNSVGNIR